MNRLQVVEYLAQEIIDSTEKYDELDGNIDYDMEALAQEVREAAFEKAKQVWPAQQDTH